MQYTLLEDAWASKARFGGKPDCRRASEGHLLKNDTAARRAWTSCDDAKNAPLNMSSVKDFLTRAYLEEGPGQLMKMLPLQFIESIQKYAKCTPAGKMYTREGMFQRYPEDEPVAPRAPRMRTARQRDDSMVNVVLYAVTLGMIALVVIDTILRFRR